MEQLSLFSFSQDNSLAEEIAGLDIGNMTPIEAMNKLYELQNKAKMLG